MIPLVSIIIPAYNAERYISETIESAIAQTWPRKEIIVVDNGSTDNTGKVIEEYKDKVIIVKMFANSGASAARNAGLKIAVGEYIQFLDADDLLSPDKIASQIQVLSGSQTYVCNCNTVYFNDTENPYSAPILTEWYNAFWDNPVDFLIKLYAPAEIMPGYGGMITIHSWLTPKNLIDKAGNWNEDLTVDDDGEFFCRVILASEGIKYSDKGVNYYRKYREAKSLSTLKTLASYEKMSQSTDLKYSHLTRSISSDLVDKIFAYHYLIIGTKTYPQFRKFSAKAINKAKNLGVTHKKYEGGPVSVFLSKLFGWRLLRILTYIRYRI